MLKKSISMILCLAIVTGFIGTMSFNVNAKECDSTSISTVIDQEKPIKHIFADNNIKLSNDSYLVKPENLVGTSLENKQVVVKQNHVYVDGVLKEDAVTISIKGYVIASLIDGVVYYVTGYSGGALAAQAISAIVALVAAHPGGAIIVAVMLLTLTSSTVQSYKTNTGNECVLAPGGRTYLCKFSL